MSGAGLVRVDGRRPDELRPVKITRNFIKYAEGSVLIEMGETKVICTVSVEEKVPAFLRGQNRGWVTAEYAMLPRATPERVIREASKGRQGGRTLEIQRLIGRSLRAVTDMDELGEDRKSTRLNSSHEWISYPVFCSKQKIDALSL